MRNEATIEITADGRDKGKTFTLREKDAVSAASWFDRAMQFLARSGLDVPPDLFQHGAAGFAVIGMGAAVRGLGMVPYVEAKPLLDEMMTCIVAMRAVQAVADVTNLQQIMTQIEEPATIYRLRWEVISLHLNFSQRETISRFREDISMWATANGPNTETSTASSEP